MCRNCSTGHLLRRSGGGGRARQGPIRRPIREVFAWASAPRLEMSVDAIHLMLQTLFERPDAERTAVVLAEGLCRRTARCSDRYSHRACCTISQRAIADAPVSDRRGSPPGGRQQIPRGGAATPAGRWSSAASTPIRKRAEALKRWGRQYWQAVHPFNPGGAYVNFMMDDEAGDRIRATYGDNYPALVELKRKCDPENLFSLNQNIAPC